MAGILLSWLTVWLVLLGTSFPFGNGLSWVCKSDARGSLSDPSICFGWNVFDTAEGSIRSICGNLSLFSCSPAVTKGSGRENVMT